MNFACQEDTNLEIFFTEYLVFMGGTLFWYWKFHSQVWHILLVNNHHLLMSIIPYKLFFNNPVFVCSSQLQFRVINNLICLSIMIHFLIINHFWNSINSIKQWFHEINWSLKLLVFWWKAKIGIKINWQPLHCWLSWSKGTSELLTTRRLDYFHFNIR